MKKLGISGLSFYLIISGLLALKIYLDFRFDPKQYSDGNENVSEKEHFEGFNNPSFKNYLAQEKIESTESSGDVPSSQNQNFESRAPGQVKIEDNSGPKSMQLREAYNQLYWQGPLAGDQIQGALDYTNDSLENFKVVLTTPSGSQLTLSFDFARVNDGGQFLVENGPDLISGIFTKGKEGDYQVRFATGPLMGTLLYFNVEEDLTSPSVGLVLEERERAQAEKIEEELRSREDASMNTYTRNSESEMNTEIENNTYEYEAAPIDNSYVDTELPQTQMDEGIDEYEMNQIAESRGFDF